VNVVEMVNMVHDISDDNLLGKRSCSSMEGKKGFMVGEEGFVEDFGYLFMNEGKNEEENGYGVEDLLEYKNLKQKVKWSHVTHRKLSLSIGLKRTMLGCAFCIVLSLCQ
jgi:hypothetical protein